MSLIRKQDEAPKLGADSSLKVLVACEESQAVAIAMRAKGHEAFSCDIQPCSGGFPEWHIQEDCIRVIQSRQWDLIIMHPPCTALANSGNRWYGKGQRLFQARLDAVAWTQGLWNLAISHCSQVAMENPVGALSTYGDFPNPQYIHPWQFGHGEQKKTGLWLHGLAPLKPTQIVQGREQRIWTMPQSPERAKLRSKTYPGIAQAMAEQWG